MSQPNEPNNDGKESGKAGGADTGTGDDKPKGEPKVYSQGDVDRLTKALDKERSLREEKERAIKDAELAKLPELEQAKAQALELAEVNKKLAKENLQFKVGADLKLPTRFWKKLDGETEAEMRADGAELLKDIKVETIEDIPKDKNDGRKPPTNDGKKHGKSGTPDMNALMRTVLKG